MKSVLVVLVFLAPILVLAGNHYDYLVTYGYRKSDVSGDRKDRPFLLFESTGGMLSDGYLSLSRDKKIARANEVCRLINGKDAYIDDEQDVQVTLAEPGTQIAFPIQFGDSHQDPFGLQVSVAKLPVFVFENLHCKGNPITKIEGHKGLMASDHLKNGFYCRQYYFPVASQSLIRLESDLAGFGYHQDRVSVAQAQKLKDLVKNPSFQLEAAESERDADQKLRRSHGALEKQSVLLESEDFEDHSGHPVESNSNVQSQNDFRYAHEIADLLKHENDQMIEQLRSDRDRVITALDQAYLNPNRQKQWELNSELKHLKRQLEILEKRSKLIDEYKKTSLLQVQSLTSHLGAERRKKKQIFQNDLDRTLADKIFKPVYGRVRSLFLNWGETKGLKDEYLDLLEQGKLDELREMVGTLYELKRRTDFRPQMIDDLQEQYGLKKEEFDRLVKFYEALPKLYLDECRALAQSFISTGEITQQQNELVQGSRGAAQRFSQNILDRCERSVHNSMSSGEFVLVNMERDEAQYFQSIPNGAKQAQAIFEKSYPQVRTVLSKFHKAKLALDKSGKILEGNKEVISAEFAESEDRRRIDRIQYKLENLKKKLASALAEKKEIQELFKRENDNPSQLVEDQQKHLRRIDGQIYKALLNENQENEKTSLNSIRDILARRMSLFSYADYEANLQLINKEPRKVIGNLMTVFARIKEHLKDELSVGAMADLRSDELELRAIINRHHALFDEALLLVEAQDAQREKLSNYHQYVKEVEDSIQNLKLETLNLQSRLKQTQSELKHNQAHLKTLEANLNHDLHEYQSLLNRL